MSSTLDELMLCASSWQPGVRLLGNVTAQELGLFCAEWLDMKVEIANLRHRLALVTADPESLASQLLSKHNALRMASENLDALQAELQRVKAQREESGA